MWEMAEISSPREAKSVAKMTHPNVVTVFDLGNHSDGSPYIALRIQELYDVTQTPRIAMGRVPVLVHILTPGMKPIQITQDLANFWREHYPRIKSELQRKYPKHLWR